MLLSGHKEVMESFYTGIKMIMDILAGHKEINECCYSDLKRLRKVIICA